MNRHQLSAYQTLCYFSIYSPRCLVHFLALGLVSARVVSNEEWVPIVDILLSENGVMRAERERKYERK